MYQKEIIYLSLYRGDTKENSAGYLKMEKKENIYRLEMQIKNNKSNSSGNFPIRLQTEKGWKEMNFIEMANGCGHWRLELKEAIFRVEIILPNGWKIKGQSKDAPVTVPEQSTVKQDIEPEPTTTKQDIEPEPTTKKDIELEPTTMKQDIEPDPEQQSAPKETKPMQVKLLSAQKQPEAATLYEDKWEQLLTTYEKIHPYGDDRVYVKLEPKDFIVLRANYQHLVNNSFLLHGFYNYRYLILGNEKDFYLGVPGVFYEREKMVALMFGFEAFECEGGIVEEGKFGYYLRKVEL